MKTKERARGANRRAIQVYLSSEAHRELSRRAYDARRTLSAELRMILDEVFGLAREPVRG